MQRLFIIIALFLVSCSKSFIEETQEAVYINVSASYNTVNEGILLSWENQRDFVRVEILKGEQAGNLSILLDRASQEELLDGDSIPGKEYYYQVKAYNSRDRQIGQSDIVKGYRSYRPIDDVEVPEGLLVSNNKYSDQIELFWLGDYLNRFRIYRADGVSGDNVAFSDFKIIAEVGFNSTDRIRYLDKDVLAGREYQYKIAAVGQDENGTVIEKYTEISTGSTLNAPNGLSASKNYEVVPGGIYLTWTEDETVSYYKIYRSDTEDGNYAEIDPYTTGNSYIDTGMPNLEGQDKDGVFTYPSYYYKIKSVKEGEESAFSTAAEGSAINPGDYLSAPDIVFQTDNTVFPYTTINLTWRTAPNKPYQVSKINLSTGATNILNQQETAPISSLVYNPNHAYLVRYINTDQGGILGQAARYNAVTPSPPALNIATKGARDYTTNETTGLTVTNTHIYWTHSWYVNEGSMFRPKWVQKFADKDTITGMITKEWTVSSTGGFINLEWASSSANENIDSYNIYRRKKGSGAFTKIYETTETSLRDDEFTLSEQQGTGSGRTFSYPLYEYQITAVYKGKESFPSTIKEGSAVLTADIPKEVVPYVSVPFHWADSTSGFGQWTTGTGVIPPSSPTLLKEGLNSPQGFDNIPTGTAEGGNAMYLAWGTIDGASAYRVKHLADHKKVWYDHGNVSNAYKHFANTTIGDSGTGLYVFDDGIGGYAKNQAQFSVASVSANGIVGYEKIILFEEPNEKPNHY